MAVYEYICRDCDASFELRRSMADADRSVSCPNGHFNVRRKLSVFSSLVPAAAAAATPGSVAAGGSCGGACGCRH